MSELATAEWVGSDKLITPSRAARQAGLTYGQFMKTARVAGLRVVSFPGLGPKFLASEVNDLLAKVRDGSRTGQVA